MFVYDTEIMQHGTPRCSRQFSEKFVMADFITCVFLVSRAETNTVLLRCVKPLVICCIMKTALTSEAFKNQTELQRTVKFTEFVTNTHCMLVLF